MLKNDDPRHAIRFGSFEMDFRSGELRKNGQRTKLQAQPFQVLAMLLRKPGEVVSREELRNQIWPQDTFVDFDTGLYTAVKKLRFALDDSASHPRFIETIPRRGYRFLIEVEEVAEVDRPVAGKGGQTVEERTRPHVNNGLAQTTSDPLHAVAAPGPRSAIPAVDDAVRRRPLRALIAGTMLAACLIVPIVYWLISRPAKRDVSFTDYKVSRLTTVGNCYDAIISPNGEFVAYVRDDGGTQSLWLRQISTGSDSLLIAPGEARYWGLTFSRDGNYIFYVATRYSGPEAKRQDAALYRIGLIGGQAVKFKEKLDSPISFSPDGRQYAFVREHTSQHESALMVASLDGVAERKLASIQLPDYLDFPAWSPDGRTIACIGASFRYPSRIVFYAADGAGERQELTSSRDWGHIRKIEWTRDGTGLLMAGKNRQTRDYQLWWLSYPGGEVHRVTNDLNSYGRLSITPDSRALVTVQETASSSIWFAAKGETASATQLTSNVGRHGGVAWNPNGRILYADDTVGESNIWIMDADGKNRTQLTHGDQFHHHPAVSPDGRYLFFVACQSDDCDIWRTDSNGAHPKRLTNGSHVHDLHCTPDGKWIVYTSPGSAQWSTLWRVAVDGGKAVQLSENLVPWAAVSPNGKWIACFYAAERADTQTAPLTLAIIPFEGGLPQRTFKVSTTLNYMAGLQWRPDGSAVTYVDNRGGNSNIWSQPITGGAPIPLTNFKGDKLFEFAWSNDGSHLAYLRGTDNSDLVLMSASE
jgi:Tol biopolymer transport system component/DNA-binding winged helix-turn-helix (wHTH) protein